MKRYASIVIVLAVILGGIIFTRSHSVEYVAPEPQVVEKEVQIDALDKAIKDAQTASSSDIESVAQKAYDEAKTQALKKIELDVIKTFGDKLDARQTELEKETKVY
jgi:hypothetical protein